MTRPQTIPADAEPTPAATDVTSFGIPTEVARLLVQEGIRVLRSIQFEALRAGALRDVNLLVCSPSGSGKTLVGELVILRHALAGRKAFLLVPLRALANEKYLRLQSRYRHFPITIAISTGDYAAEPKDLEKADVAVLTYERFDWLLRADPPWLGQIGAIVIDEVHNLGAMNRGPRLESAIVRLRQRLPSVQLVGLSGTIANPQELADWLGCQLVYSEERPVELRYRVLVAPDATQTIASLVRATIRRDGQVLVFATSRREAERLSLALANVVLPLLRPEERQALAEQGALAVVDGESPPIQERLAARLQYGVAFHHAGLDAVSRALVEEAFRRRLLKVICCTTTLEAGINTPARLVILMEPLFVRRSETGDTKFTYMDANRVHQILGRAGRPGQEALGFAILLAANAAEAERISDHYFVRVNGKAVARYDPVGSQLFVPQVLQEQVLVLAARAEGASLEEIRAFFEETHWWYQERQHRPRQTLDQLLRIGSVDVDALLARQSGKPMTGADVTQTSSEAEDIIAGEQRVELTVLAPDKIEGRVQQRGWHTCAFTASGPVCSCQQLASSAELCSHLTILARSALHEAPQYAREIIPRSLKEDFILDYLERHGLVTQREGRFFATSFGRLVVRLYVRPATALWIRSRIPAITTTSSFIDSVVQALRFEGDSVLDAGVVRGLQRLVNSPEMSLAAVSRLEKAEIGDLESLLQTAIWLGGAVVSLARMAGFEEAAILGEPVVAAWQTRAAER